MQNTPEKYLYFNPNPFYNFQEEKLYGGISMSSNAHILYQ